MRPIPFPVFLRLAADSERTGSARRWAPALQFSPRTPYSCWEGKPRSTVYFPCKHFRVRDCPARPDALNFRVLTASGDYSAASPPQPPPPVDSMAESATPAFWNFAGGWRRPPLSRRSGSAYRMFFFFRQRCSNGGDAGRLGTADRSLCVAAGRRRLHRARGRS